MTRIISSVVAGYLVMVVLVVATFAVLTQAGVFGPDPRDAPELPGTWWLIGILAISEVAAAAGAYLTTKIARNAHPKAILSLITLILFMWVISSFQESEEPLLFRFGNLVAALVGVVVGWKFSLRRHDFVTSFD